MGKPLKKTEREEKKKLFIDAMEDSWGMIATSCKRAGISKETLSNWRKADPEFNKQIDDIKERQKDFVQGQLMTAIRNGNVAATMFFLKTQCGWRETQRLEVDTNTLPDVEKMLREMKEQMDNDGNA